MSGNATGGPVSNRKYYRFVTLPTDQKFYIISAFEGTSRSASGTVIFGADLVDSATPTIASTPLVAISNEITTPGVEAQTFTANAYMSRVIRGGTLLGLWGWDNGTNGLSLDNSVANQTIYYKSETYDSTPNFSNTTAWTSTTAKPVQVKIYIQGID